MMLATSTFLVGGYIPQCDDSGDYAAVQCQGGTGYCWCADTTTGEPQHMQPDIQVATVQEDTSIVLHLPLLGDKSRCRAVASI